MEAALSMRLSVEVKSSELNNSKFYFLNTGLNGG